MARSRRRGNSAPRTWCRRASIRKAIQETRALTPNDRGVDIAIEAVGLPETWQEAVELVRKGGTVNFFGGCAANTHVTLDTNRIHYSDITLRATFHHTPAICRKALALIAGGTLPGRRIHHRPRASLRAQPRLREADEPLERDQDGDRAVDCIGVPVDKRCHPDDRSERRKGQMNAIRACIRPRVRTCCHKSVKGL